MPFSVNVRAEAFHKARETVFDPPQNFTFETREQAEAWCDRVNHRLGYQRFYVVEVAAPAQGGEAARRRIGG